MQQRLRHQTPLKSSPHTGQAGRTTNGRVCNCLMRHHEQRHRSAAIQTGSASATLFRRYGRPGAP